MEKGWILENLAKILAKKINTKNQQKVFLFKN